MGGRGSKINNPWNRGGEKVVYFVSFTVWGDHNSSISLHVSEMFKLLGAFTPETPMTLSFVDSVLYVIQNIETRERIKSALSATSYPIKGYFPLIGL